MKIVVLLKVVPDTETRFEINAEGTDVVYDDRIQWIISPYDEYALEEAIRTKEKLGGTVTIVTIGRGNEQQTIRKALAMGADDAVWIENTDIATSDVLAIAKVLAKQVEGLSPDLVLCGKVATDSNDGYVAAAVAEMLGMPVVTEVSAAEISEDKATVTRDATGRKEKFEVKLPAVLSIDKGINEPRYPKLPQIMKAKKKPLNKLDGSEYTDIVGEKKVTQIKAEFPPAKSGGVVFDGDIDESVRQLVDALVNKEKVIQ